MKLLFYVLVIVGLVIYMFLNYYAGVRGWQGLFSKAGFINKKLYWVLFWLLPLSYFVSQFSIKLPGEQNVQKSLKLIGYYWMTALMYFLIILIIIDTTRFTYGLFKDNRNNAFKNKYASVIISAFTILLVICLLIYGTWNASNVKLTKYNVNIDKQGGNFRSLHVVMVSDIHLGYMVGIKQVDKMVDTINKLKPDIVIIAGDLIDAEIKPLENEKNINSLSRINSIYGVYAVPGNHEIYCGDINKVGSLLEKAGIHFLVDEYVNIDNSFYVAGRNDSSVERFNHKSRSSIKDILGTADLSKPVIVIDHQPNNINEASKSGADILLSGHTHKGQFVPVNFITNAIYENDYGYTKKDRLSTIVSSGYGTWGPPIKIGSNSEIVDMLIKFK